MSVQARPFPLDPFAGVNNPAFPKPTGAIAGTFAAFGFLRTTVNLGFDEFINDCDYYATLSGGMLV